MARVDMEMDPLEESTRRRSRAWEDFQLLQDNQVQCLLCNAKLSYSNNTSSMLRHLRAKHGKESDPTPKKSPQPPVENNQDGRKRDLDNALLSFIIKDSHPFSVVEDEGFKEFVAKLDPTYSLPTCKEVKILVAARYKEEKEKAKAALQKVEADWGRLC